MLPSALRNLSQGLRELVFPSVCFGCRRIVPGSGDFFCSDCAIALTTDTHHTCPRCSSSVGEFTNLEAGCPRCRGERHRFDESFRLGPYEGLLRDLILKMKEHSGEVLAECLGRLWATTAEDRFRQVGAHVVIPMPLHYWRKWRRGYNQSEALSEAIAARLKQPLEPGWLMRRRHTPHQTSSSATERRENLRGAFRVRPHAKLAGACVLLVDDVLTTGATASEAARALKEAGASRVVVAVLANR